MKLWTWILIAAFLAIYGGLHLYVYKKTITIIPTGHGWIVAAFCFLVVATLLVTGSAGSSFLAMRKLLGWICYVWMGFVFLLFSTSLALDLYQFAADSFGRLLHVKSSAFTLAPNYSVIVALIFSLGATTQGFFAARRICVDQIVITTPKLDASHNPFRIVQISDLHLGLLSDVKQLRRLIETIRSLEPDVIVSTGDLVDVQMDHLSEFADLLGNLKTTYGKFAVTGNHEAFAGIDRALGFTERAGFKMLSYDGVRIADAINIVGVDDPAVSNRFLTDVPAERDLLRRYPEEEFTVLLKHQPVVDKVSPRSFDLQLSGHTHGGQIFPFILLTRLFYSARIGLSRIGEKTHLYVSRGTGFWGPPIRFLAPPELTVFELRTDRGGSQDE